MVFTGYRRVLPTIVLAMAEVFYNTLVYLPQIRELDTYTLVTNAAAAATVLGFSVAGLYASARLVNVVARLDRARDELAEHAANAERHRLSADLHDVLGQSLTAISLKGDLARQLVTRDRSLAATEVDSLLALAEAQAAEVEAIAHGQRKVALATEADEAIGLLRAAGVEVQAKLAVDDLDDLDEQASTLLGWAMREGATNVLRHAHARHCDISVSRSAGQVRLELLNDGADKRGDAGSGLIGLAERLAAADGVAEGTRLPGSRFRLRVEVPG